ncbi:MAG: sugar ABC transporter substrate-binding protein [Ornithinimicrobium sp.]
MHTVRRVVAAGSAVAVLVVTASCGSEDSSGQGGETLTIAAVNNSDLDRLRDLNQEFLDQHSGVDIEWVRQTENELRETVSTDVGTEGGRFDVVTVGTFEAQIWSDESLLQPLTDMPDNFDSSAFVPTIREALTPGEEMLAAPFYGESSFTMYRTDLFEEAGLEMPEQPTWGFIIDAAQKISEETSADGICLRGKPGWGENMGFLTAMAHSYGARWFDEDWRAQLDSDAWLEATADYLELAEYAPSTVTRNGYQENLELFRDGECGIWVDATIAASSVTDSQESSVADNVDFAPAPGTGQDSSSNWLWAWSLAIPSGSEHKELAKEYVAWATSADYIELAASEYGWANVPAGARADLYENSSYTDAAPFADLVLTSIESADPTEPTSQPVPYHGIQYVDVPAFQSIGNAVGAQMTDAISGEISGEEALENSQWVADRVIERVRLLEDQQGSN